MYSKILSPVVFLMCALVYGQNITVTRVVTEASIVQPLPNINTILKNTAKGCSTDFDGSFVLNNIRY